MTRAEMRFKRADRLYRAAVRMFFGFSFVMLIVIIAQVATLQTDFARAQTAELKRQEVARQESRKRLDRALAETNKQQVVTQNYIRCVAVISLLPIEQRSAKMLDECGIPGVTDPDKLGQPSANRAPAATPNPSPQSSNPTANQPVATGAPPDDKGASGDTPAAEPTPLGKLPFIGGFFDSIGL